MIGQETVLVSLVRLVDRLPMSPTPTKRPRGRPCVYAERLFVNFTGVEIKAGDHLAEVYSPDLIVAQQELLIALQGGAAGESGPLVETAKLKLRRWGLTEEQIAALVEKKQIADRVTL